MSEQIIIKNQWDDFLVRSADPYANTKYSILLNWLPNLTDKNILVVGSGSGELVVMLATRGAKVTAIDISKEYVDLTRQAITKARLSNVTCIVSTIEDFSTQEQFDVVVATDVIEHINDDQHAFNCCISILKNNGLIVMTVPSLQFLFGYHDEILGHYRRYNKTNFSNLIPPHVSILKLRYFGFFLIPIALIISRILRRSYPVQKIGKPSQSNFIFSMFINILFLIEKKLTFPIGTSLLFMGKKG